MRLDTLLKKLKTLEEQVSIPGGLTVTRKDDWDIIAWRGQTVKVLKAGLLEALQLKGNDALDMGAELNPSSHNHLKTGTPAPLFSITQD